MLNPRGEEACVFVDSIDVLDCWYGTVLISRAVVDIVPQSMGLLTCCESFHTMRQWKVSFVQFIDTCIVCLCCILKIMRADDEGLAITLD